MSKEGDSSVADSSFNDSVLKNDFDLSTLKIAELKSVLASNEIGFKAHDKKASLVKLVEENLESIRKNLDKDRGLSPLVSPSVKVAKKKRESKKRKSNTPEALEKSVNKAKASKTSTIKEESEPKEGEKAITKKRKKRPKEEDGQNSDVDDPERSKKTKKIKKKKVKSESLDSPIAKKVISKSPIKSPHRSLIIDKFESSDDASEEADKDDSFINFSIKKTSKSKKSGSAESSSILSDSKPRNLLKAKAGFASVTDSSLNPSTEESTPIKKASKDSVLNKTLKEVEQELVKEELPKITSPEFQTLEEVEKLQEQVRRSISSEETEETEESDTTATKHETLIKPEEESTDQSRFELEEQSEDLLEDDNEADDSDSTIVKDSDTDTKTTKQEIDDISSTIEKVEKPSVSKTGFISIGHFLLQAILFTSIVLPILFALWYREQRIAVGFCGSEVDIPTLGKEYSHPYITEFEQRLDAWRPQCIPCPNDAICYPYLEVKCKPGYIAEESKLSLHGLVPIHATCVKDSKKQKLVQEVVKKTLELLRTKNAQESCGEEEDDFKSGISNEELYEIFYESKKPWINDKEFNALWEQVEVDLKDEPEIIWRQLSTIPGNDTVPRDSDDLDSSNGETEIERSEGHFQETEFKQGYFRSSSKKYIGLKCQFERQVHATWKRYERIIITIASVLVILQLLKRYISKRLRERERIEKISQQVVQRLQQAIISQKQPRYMSSVQLRDLILNDINNLNEKNRLWALTTKKLDTNTNVKSTLMEIHGEIMKCWEWIGVLPMNVTETSQNGSAVKNHTNREEDSTIKNADKKKQ